jgi:Mg-chelatase subunit ChlD
MANEQQLAILGEFDYVLVVDASGSMGTEDCKGRSRWLAMQETAESFARDLEKLDSDGVDLVVFSGVGTDIHTGVPSNKIGEIFATRQPRSGTPLDEALREAFKLAGKSDKKDMIVVFTDGVPDDKGAVAKLIAEQSHKQETDDALTILFIQVGYDAAATAYLQMLDDDLKGCKFDIVDVKTIEEAEKFATTTDLILAAIAG